MSGEVERMARLLCDADFCDPDDPDTLQLYTPQAERLHAAGLALVPREPDEARVDRVATAILAKVPVGYGMTRPEACEYARAACRAMVEG